MQHHNQEEWNPEVL